MMIFKKYEKYIINFYSIIMSILIISLFIYYRIIITRTEYSLDQLKSHVDIFYFFLCLAFILLHTFILVTILYSLKKKKKEKIYVLHVINQIIDFLVFKPLDYLMLKISPKIPYSGTLIIHYCNFFSENGFRINLMKSLTVIFYFLPRIIMSGLFFIEIIFFNRLEFFIKAFLLLLVPFIYILFINLCEYFYKNNMPKVLEGLSVMPKGIPNSNGVYTSHDFSIKENSEFSQQDLTHLIDNWSLLFYLKNLSAMIRVFLKKYSPYITLVTSTLYLSTFIYKIYYLFFS